MNRWSLSKRFSSVAANEFCDAIHSLQTSMEESCQTEISVSVKFYNGMKHSVSTVEYGVQEYLDSENAKKVFAEASNPAEFTEDLWNQAVFVEATLNPIDENKAPNYTFGHLEGKGLKDKTMTFYVQPEEVGGPAKEASLQRFTKLKWGRGDGYKSNHVVTLG